jgi:hypothetical protein
MSDTIEERLLHTDKTTRSAIRAEEFRVRRESVRKRAEEACSAVQADHRVGLCHLHGGADGV